MPKLNAGIGKRITLMAAFKTPPLSAGRGHKKITLQAGRGHKKITLAARFGNSFTPWTGLWVVDKNGTQIVDKNGKRIYVKP